MAETFEADGREAWIRHADSLRALARSLISDEHEAEDAVQETWLRYLGHGGEDPHEPGAWLARVLRNLNVSGHRSRVRRGSREELVARPERVPCGDEIVERMELIKRVADHVAALDEPYRSAIHMHYFEGLGVAQIARASQQPLETVRTRLRRGRAILRRRLDGDEQGDRAAWCQALAPLAGLGVPKLSAAAATSATSTASWLGVSFMTARTGWILALSLLVVAGATWRAALGPDGGMNPGPVTPEVPDPESSPEVERPLARQEDVNPRSVVEVHVAHRVGLLGGHALVEEGHLHQEASGAQRVGRGQHSLDHRVAGEGQLRRRERLGERLACASAPNQLVRARVLQLGEQRG